MEFVVCGCGRIAFVVLYVIDKNEMHFDGCSHRSHLEKRVSISGKLSFVQIPIHHPNHRTSLSRSTNSQNKINGLKQNGPILLCIGKHENCGATVKRPSIFLHFFLALPLRSFTGQRVTSSLVARSVRWISTHGQFEVDASA